MGCCEQRDVNSIQKGVTRVSTNANLSTFLQQSKPKLSQKDLANINLMQRLFENFNWTEFLQFLKSHETLEKPIFTISGIQQPTTFASQAFLLLTKASDNQVSKIVSELQSYDFYIVQQLNEQQSDLQQSIIVCLGHFITFFNETQILQLDNLGILNSIVKYLSCNSKLLRMCTAYICQSLYCYRQEIQSRFLRMKGGHKLAELIYRESDDNQSLCSLLEYMVELIVVIFIKNRDGTPNNYLVQQLKQQVDLVEILRLVNNNDVSPIQISTEAFSNIDFLLVAISNS